MIQQTISQIFGGRTSGDLLENLIEISIITESHRFSHLVHLIAAALDQFKSLLGYYSQSV